MPEIKLITHSDCLDEVCGLIRKAHREETEKNGVLYNTSCLTADSLREELDRSGGECAAAFSGSRVIGTLCVFPSSVSRWYSKGGNEQTIKYVAVDPEFQGKHVATALIEYVKQNFAYDILSVSTGEKNRHAIALYEKNGFIRVSVNRGRIHNAFRLAYWNNGCPISPAAVRMHLAADTVKCFLQKTAGSFRNQNR